MLHWEQWSLRELEMCVARTAVLRESRGGFMCWDNLSPGDMVTYAEMDPTLVGGSKYDYNHFNPEALNLHRMGAPLGFYPMGAIRAEHLNTTVFRDACHRRTYRYNSVNQDPDLGKLVDSIEVLSEPWQKPVRVLWGESDGSELPVFSVHALNEFLSEPNGDRTYGDYLDEHWDRIYALFMAGGLVEYPHTQALSRESFLQNGYVHEHSRLFIFEDWMPRSLRHKMESTTRAQVTALLVDGDMGLTALKSHYGDYLHWCLEQGGKASLLARKELGEECSKVVQGILNGPSKVDTLGQAAQRRMDRDLDKIMKDATDNPSDVTRTARPTDEVLELVRAFGALPGTTPKDASFFVHALAFPNHFSMGMNGHQRNSFLGTVLAREDSLSVIRFLGDVMLAMDGELPTAMAWGQLLAGDYDFTLSPALVIPLSGADINNRTRPRYVHQRLKDYRRDMRAR